MQSAVQTQRDSETWSPSGWREFPILQQPAYDDPRALKEAEAQLEGALPLVHPAEIRKLRRDLKNVCLGKGFLLQGGDCAESFKENNAKNLRSYFRVMLQMTTALMYGAGKPVVKVGRIAGQFAKPRSSDVETENGVELPSYRGDMVNGIEFTPDARRADPMRLVEAYNRSAQALNYLRALSQGGYASLKNVNRWNKEFTEQCTQGELFKNLTDRINETFGFIEAVGVSAGDYEPMKKADFYASHEALLLNYEEALTRRESDDGHYYDCSAHFVWIGDRTRQEDGAHAEFMRGIRNPVGMKVGPTTDPDGLIRMIDKLNPDNDPGRLTLIVRMGAPKIEQLLPPLLRRVKAEGRQVVWSCDPMHGNTIKSPNGYKTRPFNDVLTEVRKSFAVHRAEGTYAGGVHIEMTGQDVTECVGGAQAISEDRLKDRYRTHCDPRLNASQSVELAFLIAEELRRGASGDVTDNAE
ncbi:MAG: class II 3-deoxy-7-phosphoheptulonate synthase [Rickettsiales bacterium]